jgi:hypothetical protein
MKAYIEISETDGKRGKKIFIVQSHITRLEDEVNLSN